MRARGSIVLAGLTTASLLAHPARAADPGRRVVRLAEDWRFLRDDPPGAEGRELGAFAGKVESEYYAPTHWYRLRFDDVTYEPGELRAVAYRAERRIGEAVVRTAGPATALRLAPDRTRLWASGDDLGYILVEAVDAEGTPCPLADHLVRFRVDGPAEIAGVGSGNPLSLEPFQADHRELFHGKAMLILRAARGGAGAIRVTAETQGLRPGAATLDARDGTREAAR